MKSGLLPRKDVFVVESNAENDRKTVILVTVATGNQGSAVAKIILDQGRYTVRALVRHKASEKAKELKTMGAELVVGDFEDID